MPEARREAECFWHFKPFRLDFASIDGYENSWLQVSLNFTENNTLCTKVEYFPKADERIILYCESCAIESREFELCKYITLPAKRHIFGNHRIDFGPLFFHDLAACTSRHSCKSLSFLVTSLKIELEDSEKPYFSAKEKKLQTN